MFKDKVVVWVLEYIVGSVLVVVPLACLGFYRTGWTYTDMWVLQLFVICLGVTLISSASSMRQRILLSRRVDELARQISAESASRQEPAAGQNDTHTTG